MHGVLFGNSLSRHQPIFLKADVQQHQVWFQFSGRLTNLTRTIPVLIVYATAVTKEDGQVFFFPDIYGHDRVLARLEAQPYGSQD